MTDKIYRIIDANLNRAREGLRVCEDIVRFVLDDAVLTEKFKRIRHKLTRIVKSLPVDISELLASRKSDSDVGEKMDFNENSRDSYQDVFMANVQRVKEALRVLEELTKITDSKVCRSIGIPKRSNRKSLHSGSRSSGKAGKKTSKDFQKIRFETYTLEKKAIERFQAVCDIR